MNTLFLALFICFAFANKGEDKRAQACTFVAVNPTLAQEWPRNCGSDPVGAYCLPTNLCGCVVSADCWVNSQLPFCQGSECVTCAASTGLAASIEVTDHYWCRNSRYPSLYVASSLEGPAVNQQSENVAGTDALSQYYREVCLFDGSCARCDQANSNAVSPPGLVFSSAIPSLGQPSQDAIWGTEFCDFIRGAGTLLPGRPICASEQLFTDVGLGPKVLDDELTTDMNVAWHGDIGPVTPGQTAVIIGDDVLTLGTPAIQNDNITQPVYNWLGACVPCALFDASGNADPTNIPSTTTLFNYLCSYTFDNQPICRVDGNCHPCASNVECGSSSGRNCATDGTASCTGGANCMRSGACITCLSDADCVNDGGETPGQTNCDVATGICIDAFSCTTNPSCVGNGGANCQVGGTCLDCVVTYTSTTCSSFDGGETPGQPNCFQSTRQCVRACATNGDCIGTQGANCMGNGVCYTCRNDADCAPTNGWGGDGGEVPGQTICSSGICVDPFRCTSNPSCVGNGGANCQVGGGCLDCIVTYTSTTCSSFDGGETPGQPNCFQSSRQCVRACATNGDCIGTQGANCMGNGVCYTCRNDADCASTNGWGGDGGEVPGQTICTSGICTSPFSCSTNPSCVGNGGANCQVGGSCLDCVVTYTSTTCSSFDGGETPGQPNCFQSSRQCVRACATNGDCIGTQGANCMGNGVCYTCRNNADCASTNGWSGDGGETPGQTICDTTSGICTSACDGNFGVGGARFPCPSAQPNCDNDGTCSFCPSDAVCAARDGPPSTSHVNTVCGSNGICVDPFSCGTTPASSVDNAGCQSFYSGNANNNCDADGTCLTCTTNALCYANDGGRIPQQPRCDAGTGTCSSCQSNSDCPEVAANCNEDGLCYDCRLFASNSGCPIVDGPPGQPDSAINPNCDTVTGICVNFCVRDSDCPDPCYPRCNVNQGCCVECTRDSHCPLAQWRYSERELRTTCDVYNGFVCVTGMTDIVCLTDADCAAYPDNTDFLACSPTLNSCVECLFDAHCSAELPACDPGSATCVGCTTDSHCPTGYFCSSGLVCQTQMVINYETNYPRPRDEVLSGVSGLTATLLPLLVATLSFLQ